MTDAASRPGGRNASGGVSIALFVGVVAAMMTLKLWLFPERYVMLGYSVPLLLCLWHKDRRLLRALAAAFAAMSALKAYLVAGHY